MTIDQMRRDYTMSGLDEKDMTADPMVQFQQWFGQAQADDLPDWVEVNAMTLSTADLSGQVTSRIVLLKGVESSGFLFFTNYQSQKGHQLAANPQASLCFHWAHVQRQVRIEGDIEKTSRDRSETYFRSRPRSSQLGALVSEQSSEITREELENRMQQLEDQYAGADVPCPQHWGGYRLKPRTIEFWQGRPSRLHDRLVYRRAETDWKVTRLSP